MIPWIKSGTPGGIEEVSEVFQAGLRQVDIEKLTEYAFRMGSKALIQRLGFFLDLNKVPTPKKLEQQMLNSIKSSRLYLAPLERWNKKGEFNSRWNLIVNIPLERLAGGEKAR